MTFLEHTGVEGVASSTRERLDLSGYWRLKSDAERKGIEGNWFACWGGADEEVVLPGCINTQSPEHYNYEGWAWFRREFRVPDGWAGRMARLHVGRAPLAAKVWVNGVFLGGHEGYHSFTLDATLKAGNNVIVILVDNERTAERVGSGNDENKWDWFNYVGVMNHVYFEFLPPCSIDSHLIETKITNANTAEVSSRLRLVNRKGEPVSLKLVSRIVSPEGKTLFETATEVEVGPGVAEELVSAEVEHPRLWSPDEPSLYLWVTELYEGNQRVDDLSVHFGIREVRVAKNGFYLNGEKTILAGMFRHEDHPDFGFSVPRAITLSDVKTMKRMGVNFLRIHYPMSRDLLDAADRYGLMIEAEIPVWNW